MGHVEIAGGVHPEEVLAVGLAEAEQVVDAQNQGGGLVDLVAPAEVHHPVGGAFVELGGAVQVVARVVGVVVETLEVHRPGPGDAGDDVPVADVVVEAQIDALVGAGEAQVAGAELVVEFLRAQRAFQVSGEAISVGGVDALDDDRLAGLGEHGDRRAADRVGCAGIEQGVVPDLVVVDGNHQRIPVAGMGEGVAGVVRDFRVVDVAFDARGGENAMILLEERGRRAETATHGDAAAGFGAVMPQGVETRAGNAAEHIVFVVAQRAVELQAFVEQAAVGLDIGAGGLVGVVVEARDRAAVGEAAVRFQVFVAIIEAQREQGRAERLLQVRLGVVLFLLGDVVIAFVEGILVVIGVTEGELEPGAAVELALAHQDGLLALGFDDFRHAAAATAVRAQNAPVGQGDVTRLCHAVGNDPARRAGRAAPARAPVEGVAAHVALDGAGVAAQRAATALFVHQVETPAQLEATDIVEEQAESAQGTFVTGVFAHAVTVAVQAVMMIDVERGSDCAAREGSGEEAVQPPIAVLPGLRFHYRFRLGRTLGNDVDRSGQGFRRDQAGAGAARNVDALHAVDADHVQAVGAGHRGKNRHAVNHDGGEAPRQVVEGDVAHVADGAFGLHRDTGVVVHRFVQGGGVGLADVGRGNRLGLDDFVAQLGLQLALRPALDLHGGELALVGIGRWRQRVSHQDGEMDRLEAFGRMVHCCFLPE
jgi:hypothetical protein